jgi:hypothetical protein
MMQPSEADSLLQSPQRKRKVTETEEHEEEEADAEEPFEAEEAKTRCSCPICGLHVLEEDINNHLDTCLNRSTVLELVRETDKIPLPKHPLKSLPSKPRSGRKRR